MDSPRLAAGAQGDGLTDDRFGWGVVPGSHGRQGFTARLASSARRGANVPAGVPGVYRVPRARIVTVQANDTGAAASDNPWIQDAPVEYSRTITDVMTFLVEAGSYVPAAGLEAQAAAMIATSQTGTEQTALDCLWGADVVGSDRKANAYQATQWFDSTAELGGTYYAPTLPPGATGYEDHPDDPSVQIVGSLHGEGTMDTTQASDVDGVLIRIPEAVPLAEWHTPGELAGYTLIDTCPALDTAATAFDFTLDSDGRAKFMFAPTHFVDGTGWADGAGGTLDVNRLPDDSGLWGLWITFTVQRARYRFVF